MSSSSSSSLSSPILAPFTLSIISGPKDDTTTKTVPLSAPCFVGREPRSRPLRGKTIHLPATYDGVSRQHLSITRVCKEYVKITLCEKALNACMIITDKRERVSVGKGKQVDFRPGDVLIVDRYNGSKASLFLRLKKNNGASMRNSEAGSSPSRSSPSKEVSSLHLLLHVNS